MWLTTVLLPTVNAVRTPQVRQIGVRADWFPVRSDHAPDATVADSNPLLSGVTAGASGFSLRPSGCVVVFWRRWERSVEDLYRALSVDLEVLGWFGVGEVASGDFFGVADRSERGRGCEFDDQLAG